MTIECHAQQEKQRRSKNLAVRRVVATMTVGSMSCGKKLKRSRCTEYDILSCTLLRYTGFCWLPLRHMFVIPGRMASSSCPPRPLCSLGVLQSCMCHTLWCSIAMMTDAVLDLSDALNHAIAIFATFLTTKMASSAHTFGYHRAETIGALVNMVSIIVINPGDGSSRTSGDT